MAGGQVTWLRAACALISSAWSGLEVAGVLVDLDPGAQAGHVEFGVELGGVDVGADPERLHRAAGRTGQQDGMAGQAADRLLVAGEGLEGGGQLAEQRVPSARRGEGDLDGSHRLGKTPVDHRALMTAERPDAVTGPEEREVRADHPVEQAVQVRLDPPLGRRLELVRVGVVERPAAEPRSPTSRADRRRRARAARAASGAVRLPRARPGSGTSRTRYRPRHPRRGWPAAGMASPDNPKQTASLPQPANRSGAPARRGHAARTDGVAGACAGPSGLTMDSLAGTLVT